jgi:hypothetical protein
MEREAGRLKLAPRSGPAYRVNKRVALIAASAVVIVGVVLGVVLSQPSGQPPFGDPADLDERSVSSFVALRAGRGHLWPVRGRMRAA